MVDAEQGDLCALRRLPELLRTHPALLQDPVQCLVRGNPARGERPYVTYMHVRYTSAQLAKSGRLLGKKLRVYSDPSDLRTLLAVTPDGEVLEPLLASSIWRHERHSLWLRREFFKAKRFTEHSYECEPGICNGVIVVEHHGQTRRTMRR